MSLQGNAVFENSDVSKIALFTPGLATFRSGDAKIKQSLAGLFPVSTIQKDAGIEIDPMSFLLCQGGVGSDF